MILPSQFYQKTDVVFLAKSLLGKWLLSKIDGKLTGGMIIETEAYKGAEDKACHAYGGRRTKRTEIMFAKGGVSYVYLCYGMHNLFNVVTSKRDDPHAILVRALRPNVGISHMQKRRKTKKNLTAGPGSVCKALGIDRSHTGHPLTKAPIWIEDRGIVVKESDVACLPRIGVSYAQEHAHLPWRFLLANHP
ncbi:MAG: putative 3-methyladenine DNA glycosylase [Chlamydiae bacterium]|nr:putative 3-methyladenine DNA glycosylase [Chlamydiota bacterium]